MSASLSKKHFEAIATAMYDGKPTLNGTSMRSWSVTCHNLRRCLGDFNPAFNGNRFIDWCENGRPLSKAAKKQQGIVDHGHGGGAKPVYHHEHEDGNLIHTHEGGPTISGFKLDEQAYASGRVR